MGVWAQNIQTNSQGDFEKNKAFLKISKMHLVIWQMFWCDFEK